MKTKIVGEAPKIQFWLGTNTYGKNRYKQPFFRLVWSNSVYWLLGGWWGDTGAVEYRWVPKYFGRAEWILERWMAPEEFSTREWWEEQTDHGLCSMGPYPSKGFYEQVWSYGLDEVPSIEAIAQTLEYSKNNCDFARTRAALSLWHDRQKKAWSDKVMEEMTELEPAFGHNPTNLSSTKPTGDTAGLSNSATMKAAIAKHRGTASGTNKPAFSKLPPRGVSMGIKKEDN